MALERELTDEEVFGNSSFAPQQGEMSDEDVFGPAQPYPGLKTYPGSESTSPLPKKLAETKADISSPLAETIPNPARSDIPIPPPQQRSKGVNPDGSLPGREANLDATKAGDNWATFEIDQEGIPAHVVLPIKPGDRPPSHDGTFLGDAVDRYLKTGQSYGAFDTDEDGATHMEKAAARGHGESLPFPLTPTQEWERQAQPQAVPAAAPPLPPSPGPADETGDNFLTNYLKTGKGLVRTGIEGLGNAVLGTASEGMPNIITAGAQGAFHGAMETAQTAGLSSAGGRRPTPIVDSSPAAQPIDFSKPLNLNDVAAKLSYQAGRSFPSLTGGVLGGLAGAQTPGPLPTKAAGALAGGAAGAALGEVMQSLGPAVAEELQKTPDDFDGAYSRAWTNTGISAAGSAAGWALFGLSPFKEPIKNLIFHGLLSQPAAAAGTQAAHNIVNGRPIGEGTANAAIQSAANLPVLLASHGLIHGFAERSAQAYDAQQAQAAQDASARAFAYGPAETRASFEETPLLTDQTSSVPPGARPAEDILGPGPSAPSAPAPRPLNDIINDPRPLDEIKAADAKAATAAEKAAQVPDGSPERPAPADNPEAMALARARIAANASVAAKEAGNYQKAHVVFQPNGVNLPITLESGLGQERTGTAPDGRPWSVTMPYDYGYVKRTNAADGEQVDVAIGPNPASNHVFIIDQADLHNMEFDEHKVMLGYDTAHDALAAYQSSFSDGKGAARIGGVTPTTVQGFKELLGKGTLEKKAPLDPHFAQAIADLQSKAGGVAGPRPITPDQAREALRTNIDPRTGKRPQGSGALAKMRSLMGLIVKNEKGPLVQKKPIAPGNVGDEGTILQTIRALGGIRTKDHKGDLTPEGSFYLAVLKDHPKGGLVNNNAGMTLDNLRSLLQQRRWFAGSPDNGASFTPLLDMIDREVRGDQVHHPEFAGPTRGQKNSDENARRVAMEHLVDATKMFPNETFSKADFAAMHARMAESGYDAESVVHDLIERRSIEQADIERKEDASPSLPPETGLGKGGAGPRAGVEEPAPKPGDTGEGGKNGKNPSPRNAPAPQGAREGEKVKPEATAKPGYGDKNTTFTQDAAERARARLREKLKNQRSAGIDPELLQDGITLAGFHIEAGARKFAEFSKAMIEDMGEAIRPFLKMLYNAVRDYPGFDSAGMSTHEEMVAGPTKQPNAKTEPKAPKGADELIEKAKGANYGTPEAPNHIALAHAFADHFLDLGDRQLTGEPGEKYDPKKGFKSIVEARAFAGKLLGGKIEPGTAAAKTVDEAVELGAVMAARRLIAEGEELANTTGFGDTSKEVAIYGKLIELGDLMPTLGTRTSTSIANQAYSTPIPLGYLAQHLAGIGPKTNVYEPTAGNGALLTAANPEHVFANEIDPSRRDALKEQGFKTTARDASDPSQGLALKENKPAIDVVIENPPFGVVPGDDGQSKVFDLGEGYKTTEIDHAIVLRSLEAMKPDGKAVLIIGGLNKLAKSEEARSDAYNGKHKREFFLRLYNEYKVVDHFTVAGELYAKQGAAWPVDVIVVHGKGKSPLSLPAVDVPRQYSTFAAMGELFDERHGKSLTERAEKAPRPSPAPPEGPKGGDETGLPNDAEGGASKPLAGSGRPGGVRGGGNGSKSGLPGKNAGPAGAGGEGGPNRQPPGLGGKTDNVEAAPKGEETAGQVTYVPASKSGAGMGTLIPVNMRDATQNALKALEDRVGPVDKFVGKELGYTDAELGKYYGAEQIDALALALDNFNQGSGFIIGDQTGIGKGRVVSGILRYAIKNGLTPIFVTEKPSLFKDIYRDLRDTGIEEMMGRQPKFLMTNAGESIPLDEDGHVVLKSKGSDAHEAHLQEVMDAGPLKNSGYDVIFTTYNQMQTVEGGQAPPRLGFLNAMSHGAVIAFDESHNAGGTETTRGNGASAAVPAVTGRAAFARRLADNAKAVLFSSATYAKRPQVMTLYGKTDMHLAVDKPSDLPNAITRGRTPMQQVVASMLARAGQYIRRERSFKGIDYKTAVVPVDRESYNDFSNSLKRIQDFYEEHAKPAIRNVNNQLKAEGGTIGPDGAVGTAGASSTSFTSKMHNVIHQFLLALKAEPAAKDAIEALKRGEKPVLTVSSTMGSFIKDYTTEMGINPGDRVNLTFAEVLGRYLDRTRQYLVKHPHGGGTERRRLTDTQLGPVGLRFFNQAKKFIEELKVGQLPVSPIDYMRSQIEKAGYKVDEITGRTATLPYQPNGSTIYRVRPQKERNSAGKNKVIAGFNKGDIDALIINQSGSTGLSIHANKPFKDRRKRYMVVVQPEANIDTHMQLLGRVNRTGQVVLPSYAQLIADVPAEKRPAAVLAKKMASLSANTTAARGHALSAEDTPDFLNEYGDQVAAQFMEENPDIHELLGEPLDHDTVGFKKDDAMRLVSGRIPLLPLDDQEALYEHLLGAYSALVKQKEETGESILEAKTLDLDAKQLERLQVKAANPVKKSPFTEPVYFDLVDMKAQQKPYNAEQLVSAVRGGLKDEKIPDTDGMEPPTALFNLYKAGRQATDKIAQEFLPKFDAWKKNFLDRFEDHKVRDAREAILVGIKQRWQQAISDFTPGTGIVLKTDGMGNLHGIVIGVNHRKTSGNPLALSGWSVRVATANGPRTLDLSFLNIAREGTTSAEGAELTYSLRAHRDTAGEITEMFDRLQAKGREERVIVSGNLLAGYSFVNNRGQIINYTDSEGNVQQGILMPKDFDPDKFLKAQPVKFPNARSLLSFLQEKAGKTVYSEDRNIELISDPEGGLRIEVAASKMKGGKYYLNRAVLDAAGRDFIKSGNTMDLRVRREIAPKVLSALMDAGASFSEALEMERAKKHVQQGGGKFARKRATEEPGAVDAKGNPLPQKVIPGAEALTPEEMQKRELEKKQGAPLQAKSGQKPVTGLGLFGGEPENAPNKKDQGSLFARRTPVESHTDAEGTRTEITDAGLTLQFSPKFADRRLALARELRAEAESLGLGRVGIRIADVMEGGEAGGHYDDVAKLITMALESDDTTIARKNFHHEIIHALRDFKMFTDPEWATLAAEAKAKYLERHKEVLKLYPKKEEHEEESIAFEAMNDPGVKPSAFFARMMGRVRNFIKRFGNWLKRNGFQTPEDIFSNIRTGGFKGRDKGALSEEGEGKFARKPKKPAPGPTPSYVPRSNSAVAGIDRILGEKVEDAGKRIDEALDRYMPQKLSDLMDQIQLGVAPMAQGTPAARAAAKDFANAMRESRHNWGMVDASLVKNFTPEQRKRMWDAADQESVMLQNGEEVPEGEGLSGLSDLERNTVLNLQRRANAQFARAQELGMTHAEGLPSYVPRMVVDMMNEKLPSAGAVGSFKEATNLRTTTPQLRRRKYLTAAETEAAAEEHFGEGAHIVRDIRTLALATAKLEQAVAGRALIERVKQMGDEMGKQFVQNGGTTDPQSFFTIDHPAFGTWGPKFIKNEKTGKVVPVKDQNGDIVFERKPLYVHRDFEGPLKAVFSTKSGAVYQGLMALKGKSMSVIMYSPLMHNAVIWGKAIPANPRGVLFGGAYFKGNAAKNDPAVMREAIHAGLDPIGHRYFNQDLSAITETPGIAPGRSWTAQLVGRATRLFNAPAEDEVKRKIDKLGDVWHNTLLWDRVADLQMGIYLHIRDKAIAAGLKPSSAQRLAAHFANRYAGSMPTEAMSKAARQTANLLLFSRSFTLGNLGAFKDLVMGLPRDMQAQILRDEGIKELNKTQGFARRKAASMLFMDVALSYIGLYMAAGVAAYLTGSAMVAPGDNEPGKEKRFLIGYNDDGTAIYGRLPTGKVGEEMVDWATAPVDELKRKLSPYARFVYAVAANDKGFGQKLYDPYASTPLDVAKNIGRIAWDVMDSILPMTLIEGVSDFISPQKGKGRMEGAIETALPLAGITVSHGAPGGPEVGKLYRDEDKQRFRVQEALPGIRDTIRNGDIKGAQDAMLALGIPPGLIAYYIRTTVNPRLRVSPKAIRDLQGYDPALAKELTESLIKQQVP